MKYALICLLFALTACQPVPQTAPARQTTDYAMLPPPKATALQYSSGAYARRNINTLLNAARSAQGLGPVREDVRLSHAAVGHARDMLAHDYFAHKGRDGSSFHHRAFAAGYRCPAAENIAFGHSNAMEVMDAWMTSAGHRRSMLLDDVTEFGIGRVGTMWVLMLGRGC